MTTSRHSFLGFVALAGTSASLLVGCGPPAPGSRGLHVSRGGDLIATGNTVAVVDSVPGDVMAGAGDIDFDGYAGGDFLGGAGALGLAGRLGGSLRAAGGDIRIATDVGRNVTVAGGNVVLQPAGHVRGNGYFAGGAIRLEGTVDQLVRAAGGEVVLSGTIGGDVHVETDRLRVGPDAVIDGDLRYRLGRDGTADIDPDARISGEIVALEPTGSRGRGLFGFLFMLGFLAAGAVAVAVVPGGAAAAEAQMRARPGPALGLGLVWLLLAPIAVAVVAITIVGAPLALIGAALYVVSVYLARAVTAVWIGRLLLRERFDPGRAGVVLAFLAGGVVLVVLGLIPWVGTAVAILAAIFGLGATALAVWGARPAEAVEV